jgi:hypothetical protein
VGLGRIFALPPVFVALLVEAFAESDDVLVGADSEMGGSGEKLICAAAVASAVL